MRGHLVLASLAGLLSAGSFGCAASHKAAAKGYDERASHEWNTGHPIKAAKAKSKASDERDKANRSTF